MATKVIFPKHRSRLKVGEGDEEYLRRRVGEYRWIHNFIVIRQERILRLSSNLEDLMELDTLRRLVAKEQDRPGMEWLREAPADVVEAAIRNVHRGYELYLTQKRDGLKGYERNRPVLRRRGRSKESFTVPRPRIQRSTDATHGPQLALVSPVDGHRYEFFQAGLLPDDATRALNLTVKRSHGEWYGTVHLRREVEVEAPGGGPLGVDPGFAHMATTSAGGVFEARDLPEGQQRRLRNLRAALATQTPGSSNHRRTRAKVDALLARRRNIQDDNHHRATSEIVGVGLPASERPSVIVVDHLNLTRIAQDHRSAVLGNRLLQFLLKLQTKCDTAGIRYVEADPLYPSSKTCSGCGFKVPKMPTSERTFDCPRCGLVIDRDLNAARNLAAYPADGDWRAMLRARNEAHLDSMGAVEVEHPSADSFIEGDYLDHERRVEAWENHGEGNNAPRQGPGNEKDWEALAALAERRRQQ